MKLIRLALFCTVLLSSTALFCRGSLAAYSETRSFRDALDGRSMEDAISGPVDRDTSSYGDRTSASSGSNGNGNGNSNYSPQAGAQSLASPMMLTIPANGNLNGQMPVQQKSMSNNGDNDEQQQQQRSSSGSELEREAGPINPEARSAMPDGQKQLMEQKLMSMMMTMNARAQMNANGANGARNGRIMIQKNGKLQQQQQYDSTATNGYGSQSTGNTKSSSYGEASSFGEESKTKPKSDSNEASSYGANKASQPSSYGAQMTTQAPSMDEDEQQQQQSPADEQQQQHQSYNSATDEQQMLAKQKAAMTAMLMSMNNGMKYSRQAAGRSMSSGQYGEKKQPMSDAGQMMAQKMMMMPMTNKAAYIEQQQQQQQQQQKLRQMAPPMMMAQGGDSYARNANGNAAAAAMGATGAMTGNGYATSGRQMNGLLMNGGSSAPTRGGMRRANQRKYEKKVSPAMMNAMLNKMLNDSNKQQNGASSYGEPNAMAMMMRSPAGAEMMANMMASQVNGASMNAIAAMPAANQEQYKRMIMAKLMQQVQEPESYGQQQQSGPESYGQGAPIKPSRGAIKGPSMEMNAGNAGYDKQMTATMAPMSAMMDMINNNKEGRMPAYGEQMRIGSAMKPMNDYSSMNQQEQSIDNGVTEAYGSGSQQRSTTEADLGVKGNMMARSSPSSTSRPMPVYSSTMAMNGNGKNRYGNGNDRRMSSNDGGYGEMMGSRGDVEQQKQMMIMGPVASKPTMSMNMADAYATSANGAATMDMPGAGNGKSMYRASSDSGKPSDGYGAMSTTLKPATQSEGYGSTTSMARPMSSTKSAAGFDAEQQEVNDQQRQQQQDENGSAPMGQAEPFAFDYNIDDNYGNTQYRKEKSDENGVVRGSYGYMDNKGLYRHVEYVADENGFRANIKSNEPGLSGEAKSANDGSSSSSQGGSSSQALAGGSMMPMGGSMTDSSGDSSMNNVQQQQQQQQQMMMMMMNQVQSQQMSDSGEKKSK